MDLMEVEAFSFLRQEITCKIIEEAQAQNKSLLSVSVIDQVINQFGYLAPEAKQSFHTLVIRLAFNVYLSQLQVSGCGFPYLSCHSTLDV